ncbi:MAG: hypothetical protein PWP23_2308 [Candidatus Sumerlaeota bacterium]|nr:hypothetical protein [Candidatus Sumerlaeota bacterium]
MKNASPLPLRAAVCLAAILAGPPTSHCLAESVVLKNGQALSGSIRSESETLLTLTRHGQSIVIQKSEIESIDREDTSYYHEEYQRALETEDTSRVKRLLEGMKRHPEAAVRSEGRRLEEIFEGGGTEPDWPKAVDLEKASLEELHAEFDRAVDRVRWEDAVQIGRAILQRETPSVRFYSQLLEAYKQTKRETGYLFLDAQRIFVHGSPDANNVTQIYLANELENRVISLWNEQKPERTDAEIHACLLARGLILHTPALRAAPAERQAEILRIYQDLTTTDDWDYATRRVPSDFQLVLFAGASRVRAELIPIVRYFSLLKEEQILHAATSDPLLESPLREARAAYIYTVSEVIPLPKEKLWSSARDLALVRRQEPPRISDIIGEVFEYTPAKKHSELAMAYEGLLMEEALSGRDYGEGLRRAMELIAKRRCGNEFDKRKSWDAFKALAALQRGEVPRGEKLPLRISDIMLAAFSVASPYEKEKVCLMYEKTLVQASLEGEYGEGLFDAVKTLATRRSSDTSASEAKWDSFRALAALRRSMAGTQQGEPSVSEVLEAAYSVASTENQPRVALAFEDRIVDAARTERGQALQLAVRQVAAYRGQDLSDAEASWRAFSALATMQAGAPAEGRVEPMASAVFDAAFAAAPERNHGPLAVLFEDVVQQEVLAGRDRGSGLHRAVELLSASRLNDPFADDLAVWRAVETHVKFLYGAQATQDDVLAQMEELTNKSADRRVRALAVASAYFTSNPSDPAYGTYRDRWVRDITNSVDSWVMSTARMRGSLPVTNKVPPGLMTQVPELRAALQRMNEHQNYLASLDDFEARLKQRYKADRNVLPDDAVTPLVASLNDYWTATSSPAAHRRLLGMIETLFDEETRLKMLQGGLRLEDGNTAKAVAANETSGPAETEATETLSP